MLLISRALAPSLLLLLFFASACAPTAPSGVDTNPVDAPSTSTPVPTVSADSGAVSPICPPVDIVLTDQLRANYSIGVENYRNLDYCGALLAYRWVIQEDPLFTGGDPDDRNFSRLAEIYENLAAMAGDRATLRRAYLDSALVMREDAQEALRGAGLPDKATTYTLARARFYQIYADDYPDEQAGILSLYQDVYDAEPALLVDYDLNTFARLLLESGDREAVQRILPGLIAQAEDATYLEQVLATSQTTAASDPEGYYAFLLEQYRGGNREEDVIRRLAYLDIQLEKNEVIGELLPLLAELNPSSELYSALCSRSAREGNLSEAMAYCQNALGYAESNAERSDVLYRMASIQNAANNSSQAYDYAGQALQYNGSNGKALYLRATIFASGVRGGSTRAAMGYWCVADQFSRAAATGDPAIAANARRAAARYNAAGPSRQAYFFEGFRPGQSVSVSTGYGTCSTTVR